MKKGAFSKLLIILIIFANVVFTATILKLFHETGSEPSSLIVAWFAFTTGELWALATMKIKKNAKISDNGASWDVADDEESEEKNNGMD